MSRPWHLSRFRPSRRLSACSVPVQLFFEATTSPPSRIHFTTIVETRGSSLNSRKTGHIQTCILPILAIGIRPPPSARNRNHDCTIRALDHAPPVASVSPTPTPLFPILPYGRSQYDGHSTTSPVQWSQHGSPTMRHTRANDRLQGETAATRVPQEPSRQTQPRLSEEMILRRHSASTSHRLALFSKCPGLVWRTVSPAP